MKRALAILLSFCLFAPAAWAQQPPPEDTSSREFSMSCTYGVLAGTLVGAASLAFTDKPGDNLQRVARGASLGLYTGILLGLYVVYIVPGMEGGEDEEDPLARAMNFPLRLTPTVHDNRIDGLTAEYTVLRF